MGQKVSPLANRLPLNKQWQSQWFVGHKSFGDKITQDLRIRELIQKNLGPSAAIASIEIAHRQAEIQVIIHSARPGVLIGRQGQGINEVRKMLESITGRQLKVEVKEVKKPETVASLVAQAIAGQLQRQIAYRRVGKQAVDKAMQAGAKGIKIQLSGRLGGAEIARTEKFVQGLIPATVLKYHIDFSVHHCQTSYGTIGIKVWVYKDAPVSEE